jgi:hypothetical protein
MRGRIVSRKWVNSVSRKKNQGDIKKCDKRPRSESFVLAAAGCSNNSIIPGIFSSGGAISFHFLSRYAQLPLFAFYLWHLAVARA